MRSSGNATSSTINSAGATPSGSRTSTATATDELIIGVRDDPNPKAGDKHTDRRGVRIYKCTDGWGAKWERMILEDGGVAVEDLTAADLNGDGKIDIIAVGRQTGNARIYWNLGK